MTPDAQLSLAIGAAVFTGLGWIVSVAVAAIKSKDWVEDVALRVIKSAEGRKAVLEATTEKHDRVEEKLDALSKSVAGLGTRLETQMTAMFSRLEAAISRLDKDARDLEIRLAVIEDQRGARREER